MKVSIQTIPSKQLIGLNITMSIVDNKTYELWNKFRTSQHLIKNPIGLDLYSIQVYNSPFEHFKPTSIFTKWACIEVQGIDNVPELFSNFTIKGGSYAVFIHKGLASDFKKTFDYIFKEWLPESNYLLDETRAHFEVLGNKYKNNNPNSEEDVWIPILEKSIKI